MPSPGSAVQSPQSAQADTDCGYADDVAEWLAAQGLGILTPLDRAVVALVLLRCVALPTVQGEPPAAVVVGEAGQPCSPA
jgi:hypothetical protein